MIYYDLMKDACSDVNIDFNNEIYDKFIMYKELIKEWNNKINLTAITDDEEIIKKHFIDCIKIFTFEPLKNVKNVIDVGTGAGFPGIPMSILKPDFNMVLLDSLNKRVNFLNLVKSELKLPNLTNLHGRAEDYGREAAYRENFDAAVSRAVANLAVLSEYCIPYVKVGGYFIALKGPGADEEIMEGKVAVKKLGGDIEEVIKVNIEGSDLKHNLVIIRKVTETPSVYPRKAGTAAKKPIK